MARHKHDFYETPPQLVESLISKVHIDGSVYEPCAGDLAIARYFKDCTTNDIDPKKKTHYHMDATLLKSWQNTPHDWVITNPPFSKAAKILPHAFEWADKGVAFLLRLTYLEPTKDRGDWLDKHRHNLSNIIVFNPRPRFRRNNKGHLATDSVTVAWFVWEKPHNIFQDTAIHFAREWI